MKDGNVTAEAIRARRLRLKLSQSDLARRMKCHPSYVSKLELGWYEPGAPNLRRLAKALETTPGKLLDP